MQAQASSPSTGHTRPVPWPVMVLAHNEERHIGACIDSIFAADPDREFAVFIMANGCTDRTEEIVRAHPRAGKDVHLVSIRLGDKCNAWNVFVHETVPAKAPVGDVYFFMDGDARAVKGSFSVMARALDNNLHANAAAAVPGSGRNCGRDRDEIVTDRGLVANLYALRGSFVQRLRAVGVRLPLKLEGDDGLLGALIKWDLAPQTNGFDHERVVPCADAVFQFEPMSPGQLRDWKMYWKRALRYGRRRYEFELLGRVLKSNGVAGLPTDITSLYPQSGSLRLHWAGAYTLTNWLALRAMRKSSGMQAAPMVRK